MLKRSCFRTPFGSQLVNVSQKLPKSARKHFYPIPIGFEKVSLSQTFSQNIDWRWKYSRKIRENFPQQIQMHLSKKPKTFFQIVMFLKSA